MTAIKAFHSSNSSEALNFLASEIYWKQNAVAKIYMQKVETVSCLSTKTWVPRNLGFCICSRYGLS